MSEYFKKRAAGTSPSRATPLAVRAVKTTRSLSESATTIANIFSIVGGIFSGVGLLITLTILRGEKGEQGQT